MVKVVLLDFSPVGTLRFYALQTPSSYERKEDVATQNNIYWEDKHSPQGFGPFPNLYTAVEHFKRVSSGYASLCPAVPTIAAPSEDMTVKNVIKACFKTKKRLQP